MYLLLETMIRVFIVSVAQWPDFLLNFPKDFPGTEKVVLDINYRSTDYIIRLGQRIITNNTNRYEKEINGTGEKGTLTEFFSAQTPEGEADKIVSKIKILMSRGVSLETNSDYLSDESTAD